MLYPEDLRPADREALITDLLEICRSTYYLPDGTAFQGQSISYALGELRDRGWRGIGHINNLDTLVRAVGFKIVRAQTKRFSGALCAPANVITL